MFKFFATDRWYKKAAKAEGDADISAGQECTLSPEAQASVDLPGTLEGGSTYKVPYTKIVNITVHDKSDFLEFAWVYGFQVIVKKGQYKVGDQVVYVPIDSVIPQWLEDRLFPADAKIKLNKHRIRQIRIRGYASQGMLVAPIDVIDKTGTKVKEEQDLAAILGITKYEPPEVFSGQTQGLGRNRNKKHEHPLFHKYNGLDNIKWFPDLFKVDEDVVIQEKLHGTNARASVLPFMANTFMKKLKKFFGFAPKIEKCYGSNNVDISAATDFKGFYGEDIYGKCFDSIDVFSKIQLGEIVFGEIVGPGIQKGYSYGLETHQFVVFDVKRLQPDGKFEWLSPGDVEAYCEERGFKHVPILYKGKYNREMAYGLTKGKSVFDPKTKVREGVVIKAANGYCVGGNKKALKWVSEDYLADDTNTDAH